MSAAEWAVVIAAIGTILMQVIGRLQSWQLAVIAARTEAKGDASREQIKTEVAKVHDLVDGSTSKLLLQLEAFAEANAALREQVSGFVERDAATAQLAREAALKGTPPAAIAGEVLAPHPPSPTV